MKRDKMHTQRNAHTNTSGDCIHTQSSTSQFDSVDSVQQNEHDDDNTHTSMRNISAAFTYK
eukprot:scaffold17811_cov138-Skeletonema_dohrnii-CCMP3373.AAC.2